MDPTPCPSRRASLRAKSHVRSWPSRPTTRRRRAPSRCRRLVERDDRVELVCDVRTRTGGGASTAGKPTDRRTRKSPCRTARATRSATRPATRPRSSCRTARRRASAARPPGVVGAPSARCRRPFRRCYCRFCLMESVRVRRNPRGPPPPRTGSGRTSGYVLRLAVVSDGERIRLISSRARSRVRSRSPARTRPVASGCVPRRPPHDRPPGGRRRHGGRAAGR